jgi:hypothetical protein
VIELAVQIEQGADGPVDHGGLDANLVAGVLGGEADEEARDLVGALDRIARCGLATAAVGDRNRVFAQQFGQTCNIAAGHGFAESLQQTGVIIRRRRGRRAFVAHGAAGPRRQLPASRFGAVKHGGDLGKRRVEDVVKQEGRAFQWRQPVERQQQGEREIVSEFGGGIGRQALRVEHRLREPRPDIDFSLRSCTLQAIETKPGHDGDEKRLRVVHVLRAGKAEIGILYDVFRVAAASEHAIGEPEQAPAMGRQRVVVMRPV